MKAARKVVVLTGAGVSADSGVSTFRDVDGVWSAYDYREVATPEGFARNPDLSHEFYNRRRRGLGEVAPNHAHRALATLEAALAERGGRLTLVTQNVDDLHERGGTRSVLHMHGELAKARCGACGAVRPWTEDLGVETACPTCGRTGAMRPHVVWFGEIPMHMDDVADALADADLFASIGTSGAVYPAAGFVFDARTRGVPCVELNLEPSENASAFDDARYGRASEIVPKWVDELIAALDR
ncbi:MAG: NAD-dependent deacylase [Parvularculaceae bacterium]